MAVDITGLSASLLDPHDPTWAQLRAARGAVGNLDVTYQWRGGQRTEPDGPIQMPWADYAPEVRELQALLSKVGAVTPFDWPAWNAEAGSATLADLDHADLDAVVALLTTVVRQDRFVEGNIAGWLDSGDLLRLVDRLLELNRHR